MARIGGGAGLHIKEDSIITVITIEDAITDIIGLLVLILFCTLTKAGQKKRGKREAELHASSIILF